MSLLMSFGLGAATAAIIAFGIVIVGRRRVLPAGQQGQRYTEIRADRLGEISTDELSHLAEKFHVLTRNMYAELLIRRSAELGTTQFETMLRDDGSVS